MQKALEPEGSRAFIPTISLVALPCGDAETVSGGTRQHQNASSEASSRYPHSMALILPSRHSSNAQLSTPPRNACRRMTRRHVSSASGAKVGTVPNTHFELKALSFRFVPKGTTGRLQRLDSAKNTCFETQPLFSAQATSTGIARTVPSPHDVGHCPPPLDLAASR